METITLVGGLSTELDRYWLIDFSQFDDLYLSRPDVIAECNE
nr:hypothetical protein [uncultured Vibrio sp.]